jgi:putative tryptophan/tyrosine transport system substrate-binding protein
MRRRHFIAGLGAAAMPLAVRAQQPAMPAVGVLSAGGAELYGIAEGLSFAQGLREAGFVEGRNITIERRYADGQYEKLTEMAIDLVRQRVSVIVAYPNTPSARAAMAATKTIPILFIVGTNPAELGLVASLSRPGGNATGVNNFLSELTPKRLQLLHQLIPAATRFGALINPTSATAELDKKGTTSAASAIGVQAEFIQARDVGEIEAASYGISLPRRRVTPA